MPDRPNVLWLTLESTRQDHTSMDGYRRETTPNIADIAAESDGRAFDACFSHGIWTLSSSASILTGTVPSAHGVGMTNDALPTEFSTVPELLGDAGYHAECISPNPHLSPGTDLDRGFDEFTFVDKESLVDSVGLRPLLKYALDVRKHGGGFTLEPRRHTPDYAMTDLAKRRLNGFEGGDEPFFMYMHYSNPHRPYFPPRRFRERFAGDLDMSLREAGEVSFDHHDRFWSHVANGCPFSPTEWAAIEAHYDGEIAHTDELVGALVDHVRSLDLGRTIVVITGDHGEYFGEEGLLGHNLGVHDAVSNVPLVVSGFDEIAEYEGLVQHADVVRTLLELAGARTDQCQGVDLREEQREHAVVQRGSDRCRKGLRQLRERNPEFDTSRYHEGTLTGVRSTEFKYRRSEGRSELLRLPDEDRDVSDAHPDVARRLATVTEEWLSTVGRPRYAGRTESEFTGQMESRLADLGYLVD